MPSPLTPSPSSDDHDPPAGDRAPSDAAASTRRGLLAAVGTGVVGALAGCSVLRADPEPAPFHDGDWRSYGNTASNSNRVGGGAPEPGERTVLAPAAWPYVPPVVHDDVAYFASGTDAFAVERDGTEAWTWSTDDPYHEVSGVPALDPDRGRLYVPTRRVQTVDGPDPPAATVVALSLDAGEPAWSVRVGDRNAYGVTVHDGDAFVRSATACVRLAPDGTERWRRSLQPLEYDEYNLSATTATQVAPAVENTGVYVPDRNALVKLAPETGDERWRVDANAPYAAPVFDDGGVVQTGWQGVVAVDRFGDVRWRRDLQSLAAPAVDDGDVYVVASDLHELDAVTGATNWQTNLSSDGTAAPVVTEDAVVVVDDVPMAVRRDADGVLGPDRERWRASSTHANEYASPVIADGRLFAVGQTGLFALDPATDR